MHRTIVNLIWTIGLFFGLVILAYDMAEWRAPNNQQGYSPVQPIAYSHRLHAGELGIDCRFCHTAAEHGRHAGIPSASVCLNCHRYVTSSFNLLQAEQAAAAEEDREPNPVVSDELQRLYDELGLEDPKQRLTEEAGIPWVRVHNLPDFVAFDHRAHITAGVTCQKCHGPVESMERVRQFESLSMGWCVDCHRDATANGINGLAVDASIDCTTCHY